MKVTRLVLATFAGGLLQTFEVPFADDKTLYEALEAEYGDQNPMIGHCRPLAARIEIEFEPEAARSRGKKIKLELAIPNKCNLRGKTKKERLILNRYLRPGAYCGATNMGWRDEPRSRRALATSA